MNTTKKIIVFTKHFVPVYAGRDVIMYETYKRMIDFGWQTSIYTSKSTYKDKDVLSSFSIYNGINIFRHSERSYAFPLWIRKINLSNAIICIHGTHYYSDLYLYIYFLILKITNKRKFKIIFTSHGSYSYRYQFDTGFWGFVKRTIETMVSKLLLNNIVDGFCTVSQWEAECMNKFGISKVTVIPNGLPNIAYSKSHTGISSNIKKLLKNNPEYIVQIGRIERLKNLDVVIRALPHVKNEKLKYFIIGEIKEQEYKKELDNLINKFHLSDRVFFLGTITGIIKYELLKKSKAYVQMSISEGFGITVVEAMSQGVVCLVSKGTALSQLVKDSENGYTIDPKDSPLLADRIDFILDPKNNKVVSNIQKNNLSKSLEYKWDNIVKDIDKFYLSML